MSIELTDDQRRSYLRDEYLFLQTQYEDYDKRSLTIKGWASSGATAALALAFNVSYGPAILVPAIVAVIVAVIWYLEAYWKLFQYALSDRIRIIEAYFRSDPDVLVKNPDPFQIYNWWFRTYAFDEPIFPYERDNHTRPKSHYIRLLHAAFLPFVCLPYLPIIILSLASLAALAQRP